MAWPGYSAALSSDPAGVAAVLAASPFFSDPTDLAWAIELESGWNPTALNKTSGAYGLIQFLPSTLAAMHVVLGPTSTRSEQAPVIRDFFLRAGLSAAGAPNRRPGDALLSIFAPAGLGKPDAFVLYPVGSAGWKQNAPYRSPGDGDITAGSVRAAGTPRAMRPGKAPPLVKVPPKAPPKGRAAPPQGTGWLILAACAMYFSRRPRVTRRRRTQR